MIHLLMYLLPISGECILNEILSMQKIKISGALLPGTSRHDLHSLTSALDRAGVPWKIPGRLDQSKLRDWVKDRRADLGLSVGYDRKIPPWLVDHPDMGTINMHPSLLPRYRGANPYFWVIRNGEHSTGVTLHYMDEEFDTGPVIQQQRVPLQNDETMGTLFRELTDTGVSMLVQQLESIVEHNEPPASKPQEDGAEELPEAPRVRDRHLRIDWTRDRASIDSLIRAANPFFGAFTTFAGMKVRLYDVELLDEYSPNTQLERDSIDPVPSRIVQADEGPLVRCRDGWIRWKVVEVDDLYRCSGSEFQRRESSAFDVLRRVV